MSENPMNMSCPIPHSHTGEITLAHGGGGTAMHRLLEDVFFNAFNKPDDSPAHDSYVFNTNTKRMAFTTDTFVVQPLQFPGGDIGSLAVHGTVNDLAMAGARPLYLSAGFVLEEGLSIALLKEIVASMARAAKEAGVKIVTGDTKVVERGRGDGLFINTAGVGVIEHDLEISPASIRPSDAIIINNDIGRHGIAIMASRGGLEFETPIESDSTSLAGSVLALLEAGIDIHCMRDLTRGGLASGMNEIASDSGWGISLKETSIPIREDVRGACELLGFDPCHIANEGCFAVFVPEDQAVKCLKILKNADMEFTSAQIGSVTEQTSQVIIESAIGVPRILDMLSGEQLPRIC